MDKVLVLSEHETASGFLGLILQQEYFLPILANSRDAALQNICTLEPGLLIIEIPFAGITSVELCSQLRTYKITKPMIVLGDSSEEIDKVLALEGVRTTISSNRSHRANWSRAYAPSCAAAKPA